MAKIDVLLPVKNGVAYLAESIDSILSQTVSDWRLLVLDHGSTDGTVEMVQRYREKDSRIVLHSQPNAPGLSGLLNYGLTQCDAEFVMRHDADDICFPDRMQKTLDGFARWNQCILLGGQADIINGRGQMTGRTTVPQTPDRIATACLFRNPIVHPTVAFRFDRLMALNARYGVDFTHRLPAGRSLDVPNLAEDYFMFGQLALGQACVNLPDSLIKYRWHGSNVSVTKYHAQMEVSLRVARFLAEAMSQHAGREYIDPAPLCNLGGSFFDVDGKKDFSQTFHALSAIIHCAVGDTHEVQREMAFRWVASTRQQPALLWRYLQFSRRYITDPDEWSAVKTWTMRHLPGRARTRIARDPLDRSA